MLIPLSPHLHQSTLVAALLPQPFQDEELSEQGAQKSDVDGMRNADRAGSKNVRLEENQRGKKQNLRTGVSSLFPHKNVLTT